ncbi:MAG: aldolase/citrate lyase family protein [Bacteroidales bacterium]
MSTAKKIACAGNKGVDVRSDCHVEIELQKSGGRQIDIHSKVEVMFGKAIRNQITQILEFFEIHHAKIVIEDSGAVPFVIAARLEAAIKKLIKTEKDFFMDIIPENEDETKKDIFRFSRLYLPGNTPRLMINAGIHKPNGLILDLEDAVAPEKKHEARYVVRNALRSLNFYGAERMVRINQVPMGLDDLDFIVPHNVNLILVPKCEGKHQIDKINKKIEKIKTDKKIKRNIWLMPIIESSLGVIKSYEIASAAENVVALAIGLEDYTADLGTKRTKEGTESFFARSMVVNAAKAAHIQAIDSVFSDISDMDALARNVQVSKGLGFDGMGCIHPRQIKVIHENFAPDKTDIERAQKIVNAFIIANEKGLGVVALGSKMIDAPVVKRATKTVNLAISLGLIDKNWRNEFVN